MTRTNWTRTEIAELFDLPFTELVLRAAEVHRAHHAAGEVQLCTLLSIKTGGCPEDCGYCSQSAHAKTGLKAEKLMDVDAVLAAAAEAKAAGSQRFCMGAAWREPKDRDMDAVCAMVAGVKAMGLETCMTLGMLTGGQARALKDAGLDYYNHNIDTSPEHYGDIITTRTFQERLDTLEEVRGAGMAVCCGGIVGMGETPRGPRRLHPRAGDTAAPSGKRADQCAGAGQGHGARRHVAATSGRSTTSSSSAPSRWRGSPCRESMVRLSAGRESMSEARRRCASSPARISIFTGDKLLTTANAGDNADAALFAKLGLKPMEAEEPMRSLQLAV